MTMATHVRMAVSRKWLHIAAVALLVVIAIALLVRSLTGTTLKEQKLQQQADKQALDLSRKPAPNPESLSVKLEQARSDAAKDAAKAATVQATADAAKTPSTSTPGTVADTAGHGKALPAPASVPPSARTNSKVPLPSSGGWQTGSDVSDEQLDGYAHNKEAAMRDANRRLAGWEGSGQAMAMAADAKTDSATAVREGPGSNAASSVANASNSGNPAASLMETYLKAQQGAQSGQSSQEQFKQTQSKRGIEPPLTAVARPGQYVLMEGSSWPVVMDVAVSSDIAGPCSAMVVRDIYDSLTQKALLIPAGSKAICAYDAGVVQGQERLLISFTRLILPNGQSVALAGMPGADLQGAIGAPAEVNTRFWKIYGTSLLIAAVSRAAEKSNPASTVTINATGATAASTAAGVLAETAKKTMERNLNIKPELRVSAGDILRVVVTRDIALTPLAFR